MLIEKGDISSSFQLEHYIKAAIFNWRPVHNGMCHENV